MRIRVLLSLLIMKDSHYGFNVEKKNEIYHNIYSQFIPTTHGCCTFYWTFDQKTIFCGHCSLTI